MSTATAKPTMAPPAPTTSTDSTTPSTQAPEWDEPQYIAALAKLETLQSQIDSLRLTIPSLVRSLVAPHANPEALFRDFQRVTVGTAKGLVALKRGLEDKETREIFERVKVSGEKNAGSVEEVTSVPVYGWVEEEEKGRKRKIEDISGGEGGEEGQVLGDEEVTRVLEEYRQRNEGFEVTRNRDGKSIAVKFKAPDNLPLDFTIQRSTTGNKRAAYTIKGPSCPEARYGDFQLFTAVQRCLDKRPKPNDLEHCLDMIAAYKDLRLAKCDSCGRLLDGKAMTPAARQIKKTKAAEGKEEMKWVAVHESCTDKKT